MIYDLIIVGTGAGGATVAHELFNEDLNLLILDKGTETPRGNAASKIKITDLKLEIEEWRDICSDKETELR